MPIARDDLIGSWLLVRWEALYEGGARRTFPFGEDAQGLLLYGADGWMSAAMWQKERTPLSADSARLADSASKARAMEEILGYCGRWRLEGDVVVHEVIGSVNPTLVGSDQRRAARILPDGVLDLTARESPRGAPPRVHRILWRRAPARG